MLLYQPVHHFIIFAAQIFGAQPVKENIFFLSMMRPVSVRPEEIHYKTDKACVDIIVLSDTLHFC
jgi:hypothetical protein